MVLLEVTWIFSFHPQACSLILADRQHWKSWGVQLQLRWCPAVAPEVAGGDPCPTPLCLPRGANVPSGCSALSSAAPLWPCSPCRAHSPRTSAGHGECFQEGAQISPPQLSRAMRDDGQGFLFLSSSSASGEAVPSMVVPPGAPIPPSSSWHFSPLKFGLVPFDEAFWKLP